MPKKNISVIIAVIILVVLLAGALYMYENKKTAQPSNNNQQQEQNNNQNNQQNQTNTQSSDLKAKTLELVGLANAGKKEDALNGYLALLKDNPDDLLLLNNTAVLYSDMANWTKSEEYYKKLIAVHPDFIQGYRMLAYLYEYRFNDDEGKIKATIDDGLAKNNNNSDLLNWIIAYYQEKGEGEKALPYSKILAAELNQSIKK